MRSRLIIAPAIAATALGLLASCAPVDPGFGEALKYDMAVQTVDPDPVYREGAAVPGDSGVMAAKAAERYRKGAVKPIERVSTSSGSGGGSGGGAGPQ